MENINLSIAHITASDGTVFQVLNEDGTDWDEVATRAQYQEYESGISK